MAGRARSTLAEGEILREGMSNGNPSLTEKLRRVCEPLSRGSQGVGELEGVSMTGERGKYEGENRGGIPND